jgi:hypothetical protein
MTQERAPRRRRCRTLVPSAVQKSEARLSKAPTHPAWAHKMNGMRSPNQEWTGHLSNTRNGLRRDQCVVRYRTTTNQKLEQNNEMAANPRYRKRGVEVERAGMINLHCLAPFEVDAKIWNVIVETPKGQSEQIRLRPGARLISTGQSTAARCRIPIRFWLSSFNTG